MSTTIDLKRYLDFAYERIKVASREGDKVEMARIVKSIGDTLQSMAETLSPPSDPPRGQYKLVVTMQVPDYLSEPDVFVKTFAASLLETLKNDDCIREFNDVDLTFLQVELLEPKL